MSYILDALRKSETERQQGKVPDLAQQVQLIHRPKKRRKSPVIWVALALLVNAGVLAVIFWPQSGAHLLPGVDLSQPSATPDTAAQQPVATPEPDSPVPGATAPTPVETEGDEPADVPSGPAPGQIQATEGVRQRPVIITPSLRQAPPQPSAVESALRVPHLVELPLAFQKSVPDLMFNSHIYSTDAQRSRVMINGHYLRPGEAFSGITVEEITEEGVVLRKQGTVFRVGIVRDWVSPG